MLDVAEWLLRFMTNCSSVMAVVILALSVAIYEILQIKCKSVALSIEGQSEGEKRDLRHSSADVLIYNWYFFHEF